MTERKYAKYLVERKDLKFPSTPDRDGKIFHDIVMGNEIIPEVPFWVYTGLISKAGAGYGCGDTMVRMNPNGEESTYQTRPHKHPNAEAFIFLGTDPDKPSNLCGEVEFWIGEGEEAEMYTITTSTYIFVPPNVVHAPIWVKRVDKPFLLCIYRHSPEASFETGPHPFPPDFIVQPEFLNREYKGPWPEEVEAAMKFKE